MKKMYFLGLVLALMVVAGAVLLAGSSPLTFLSIASLIVVLLPGAFLSLASFGIREIGRAFVAGFGKAAADPAGLRRALAYFDSFQNYLVLSGLMGLLIGMVTILSRLDDPQAIRRGMAIALLVVLYSVVLIMLVVLPFKTGLRKRLAEMPTSGS